MIRIYTKSALCYTALSLLGAAGCFSLSGCSAGAPEGADSADTPAEQAHISEATSKIDVLSTLCSIVNDVPSFDIGAFTLDKPTCSTSNNDAFYYLGADGPGSNRAQTLADATYCTIAGATGPTFTGNAVFPTIVGGFGAKSVLRSFARDNQARHIEAEHTGTAQVFGIEVPLQYSTVAWDFPSEHQPARGLPAKHTTESLVRQPNGTYHAGLLGLSSYTQNVPDRTGFYSKWHNQNLDAWSIGGSGTIPITPALPLHVEVKLATSEALANFGNGQFDTGVTTNPDYLSTLIDGTVCRANCNTFACYIGCPNLTSEQTLGHELTCAGGCNSNYWHNLGDGILPYNGHTSGASGNLLYQDPILNYWRSGYPGSYGNAGETVYSILGGPNSQPAASTAFTFDTKADYDAGIAELEFGVNLDYFTRVGAALRTRSLVSDTGHAPTGDTEMRADAETAINLDAFFKVHIDLVFSSLDFGFHYDLLDKSGNGHKSTQTGSGGGYSWADAPEGMNDAGTASCTAFAPPDTSGPTPPTSGGWDFVQRVGKASVDQFHPCNVQICVPSAPGSQTGTFTYYDWDSVNEALTPRPSTNSCSVCDSSAAMCNSDGRVISPSKIDTPVACGGQGDTCGGKAYCDSVDDCGGPESLCVGNCCEPNPR